MGRKGSNCNRIRDSREMGRRDMYEASVGSKKEDRKVGSKKEEMCRLEEALEKN